MKFDGLMKAWAGVVDDNRVLARVTIILAAALFVALVGLVSRKTTVVAIPPTVTEEVSIGPRHASDSYLAGWGLHVANLIGNVTPSNVGLVRNSLEPILGPEVYRVIMTELDDESRLMRQENLSTSFRMSGVTVERRTVAVTGTLTTWGLREQRRSEIRTYEMTFEVRNYQPIITRMSVYEGSPKTQG